MPRSGQIIPEYLHPHEATYINDNTRYEDYVNGNADVRFLNVFASSKGRDNVLLSFTSVTDWVNEYGLPDYRRYGQPGYNAYVALSTGLAGSQSMRVMPPDAAYANMVLLAKYQVLDGKLKMKFETKTVTGILNSDDFWLLLKISILKSRAQARYDVIVRKQLINNSNHSMDLWNALEPQFYKNK